MSRRLRLWRCIGALALAGLSAGCLGTPLPPLSFDGALQHLETDLLPQIALEEVDPLQAAGLRPVSAPTSLADQLPAAEAYPLQGDNPQLPAGDGRLQVEIVSSAEKADGSRPERRWLVEVAERFNQRQERSASGRRIEVVIRTIPSGLAAQMLLAGRLRPAGYTPASAQWLDLLQRQGLAPTRIAERLVGNGSVIAMHRQAWRRLGGQGAPDFAGVVDHALAGRLRMGFCNPYICSPGLDFLHTLLWVSAGHSQAEGRPALQTADLQRQAVTGSFALFQQRLASTSPTYLEQVERWRSDPQAFDAVLMAQQSYRRLRRQPGFEDLEAVPFGSPQDSPLASLPWTSGEQQEALRRFAAFATGPQMQALARQWDFQAPPAIPPEARPPLADGEVLRQAQGQWKRRKDGARTVYLQLVIDRSGSMRQHGRMRQLKKAVAIASGAINPGNQVGLISFGDRPIRHLPLQPYDSAMRGRLLAAVQELEPEGSTAIYDGLAVAVADLMRARQRDPQGRFVVLLLSDGDRTSGLTLPELQPVLAHSGITVIPIAYGEVNARELQELAAIREGSVYAGSPDQIVPLMNDLLQTTL